jgi:uncharacterized protein YdiU (UPF0061 family)
MHSCSTLVKIGFVVFLIAGLERNPRQVRSGHYVLVKPTPLPNPKLAFYSPEMAAELGITECDVQSNEFVQYFGADASALPQLKQWATPYALCIYGQQMFQQCPFGNGNGYGDGRALSVAEVEVNGKRWELQLKG